MARTKRSLFAALGWLVWQLLAKVGLPLARRKIRQDRPGHDRPGGSTRH